MSNKHEAETILVIEDEVDVRNFVSRVLELEGYRTLQAEDGNQGIKIARKNSLALILLDLRLPERDGWSVLAEMKEDAVLSAIPVVVLSASAETAQRERAFSEGAVDYLVKPISAASLRETVTRILNQRGDY